MPSANHSNPRLPFTATTPSTVHSSPEVDRISQVKSRGRSDDHGRRQKNTDEARVKVPELNIITNFSKPSFQRDAAGSLAPSDQARQDTILHRRKRSREQQQQGKGPIDSLKSGEKRVSELSPGDGDLMIGISMPSVMEGNYQRQGTVVERNPENEPQSANPEIIITPAGLESPSPWLGPPDARSGRRGHTSSIYSRATHIPGAGQVSSSPRPPVPPIPRLSKFATTPGNRSESRVGSWADSDDEYERDIDSRPVSRESEHGILRRNSADTIATKHRSQGWWNHIVTPFLNRVDSAKTNQFATPKIPSRFQSTRELNLDEDARKKRETGRTSVWFDKSRDTLAFFRDNDSDKHESVPPLPSPLPSATYLSPDYEEPRGLGEAAEYYEASYHDLNDPHPYYECQNHICSYGSSNVQRWRMKTSPVDENTLTAGNLRGLDETMAQDSQHGDATPTKGSTARIMGAREARISIVSKTTAANSPENERSPTEIDDSPNESPAIKAVEVARVVRAPSPVPTVKTSASEAPAHTGERGLPASSPVQAAPTKLPTPPLPPPLQPPAAAPALAATPAPEPMPVHIPAPAPAPVAMPVEAPAPLQPSPEFAPIAARAAPVEPVQISTRAPPEDIVSPGPLTPGMRRDVANKNAIPMGHPRFSPHPPSPPESPGPATRAVLSPKPGLRGATVAIEEPRAAQTPPTIQHTASNEALGSHPTFGAQYPGQPRELQPGAPGQPVLLNQYFGTPQPSEYQSQPRGSPMAYYPPPPGPAGPSGNVGQAEQARSLNEKVEEKPKGPSKISKLFGLLKKLRSSKERTSEQKKKRRIFWMIFGGLLAMVILILVLVMTLAIKHDDIPIQSSWLNLTNYPPIQTGVATIAQPNVKAESGCVAPQTMWSCAVPKEEQDAIKPNKPDQPNFRLEIRFQNGTNLTNSSDFAKRSRITSGLSASEFLHNRALAARDFTSSLFEPSPKPPSDEEQAFLGNTTDGNDSPFGGEPTPFYISFLPATKVSKRFVPVPPLLAKRQDDSSNSTNSSDPFPNVSNNIPPPAINSDGTAADANLLPFPSAQPLMLYNRGKNNEHYGFYSYFDRAIFLKNNTNNVTDGGPVETDEDGGAPRDASRLRCTWPQTRFLVQIWTNAGNAAPLLGNGTKIWNGGATSTSDAPAQAAASTTGVANSSANVFEQPGSFPYPVTVTMDRHGGDIEKKNVYCYGMDDQEHILEDEKKFQLEDRGFGGQLVNPAIGLFDTVNITKAEGGPGGADGGTGGCSCIWTNFQTSVAGL
ncbi:MAG: hypothetical protein MMC23_009079 [Stictis urceolatum]|nr:hypothetical protein [Stictis urceolata]